MSKTPYNAIVLLIVACFEAVILACNQTPQEKANYEMHQRVHYYKDHEHGYCFAVWRNTNGAIGSAVPCDSTFYKACGNCANDKQTPR